VTIVRRIIGDDLCPMVISEIMMVWMKSRIGDEVLVETERDAVVEEVKRWAKESKNEFEILENNEKKLIKVKFLNDFKEYFSL
jgi:TusA-related sulfurtransferase